MGKDSIPADSIDPLVLRLMSYVLRMSNNLESPYLLPALKSFCFSSLVRLS